jgi:hypothetical protein
MTFPGRHDDELSDDGRPDSAGWHGPDDARVNPGVRIRLAHLANERVRLRRENQLEQILYPVANFRNTMNLLFEHWDFGFQRCSGPKQVNESTRRSA